MSRDKIRQRYNRDIRLDQARKNARDETEKLVELARASDKLPTVCPPGKAFNFVFPKGHS